MSWLIAVVLALCVPFAQLVTETVRVECCCPDPDKCRCPDHKPDHSEQSSMRACHKQSQHGVANPLAAFIAPSLPMTITPAQLVLHVPHVIVPPHEAPPPRRPDAPS